MKTKIYSLLALAGWLLLSAIYQPVNGRENGKTAVSSSIAERALQYFEKTGKGDLGEFLKSIQPAAVSAGPRAQLVASIKKEDIVSPSAQRQAKLCKGGLNWTSFQDLVLRSTRSAKPASIRLPPHWADA